MQAIPTAFCRICNRPLTDPVSVRVGVGPVCRVKQKNKDLRMKKTGTLFGDGVSYTYGVTNGVLHIVDKDGAVSVTNAMERVLLEIWEQGEDLPNLLVIYKDSLGTWDGVHFTATKRPKGELVDAETLHISGVRMYSINETELEPALAKARPAKPTPEIKAEGGGNGGE